MSAVPRPRLVRNTDAVPASPAPPIQALRAGDPDALAQCYRAHVSTLLTLATRLLGERADAEDVVQDVFVGLPEALGRYEERGAFGAWLRRLTARHALMRLRRVRRRREVSHDESMRLVAPIVPSTDMTTVERALRALPDGVRHVFVLRVIEGHSHAEIAALLGITVGASEVRLSRGIKALRGLLGDMQ